MKKRGKFSYMQLSNDAAAKKDITNFITVIARDTPNPNLMNEGWVEKIMNHADIFICKHNNQIVGWLVLYANNYDTKVAYVAGLHVLDVCRRHRIASSLLEKAIFICKIRLFRYLTLYCNNPIAEKLYKKYGFVTLRNERVPKLSNEFFSFMSLDIRNV